MIAVRRDVAGRARADPVGHGEDVAVVGVSAEDAVAEADRVAGVAVIVELAAV